MSYTIKISNLENQTTWEKQLDSEQFETIKQYAQDGHKVVSVLSATLQPVRTNHFKNFAKDFFLPTLANHAIKVQHAVGKIFAIIGALILDTLTFPIRLLTCIPRVIKNKNQVQNPLKKYLIDENVDSKLLESGHVKVRLEWSPSAFSSRWTSNDNTQHFEINTRRHWREQNFNFIEVPVYPECNFIGLGYQD